MEPVSKLWRRSMTTEDCNQKSLRFDVTIQHSGLVIICRVFLGLFVSSLSGEHNNKLTDFTSRRAVTTLVSGSEKSPYSTVSFALTASVFSSWNAEGCFCAEATRSVKFPGPLLRTLFEVNQAVCHSSKDGPYRVFKISIPSFSAACCTAATSSSVITSPR